MQSQKMATQAIIELFSPLKILPNNKCELHSLSTAQPLFSETAIGECITTNKTSHVVPCVVDMVVLVGDLVDGQVDELKFAAEPLKELSPLKGKYFVTGKVHILSTPISKVHVDVWKFHIFSADLLSMTVMSSELVSSVDI